MHCAALLQKDMDTAIRPYHRIICWNLLLLLSSVCFLLASYLRILDAVQWWNEMYCSFLPHKNFCLATKECLRPRLGH